ncbi:hypothetical protein M758_11G020900 [Ceratodon purpureus]|nr:hypothetical protein M758_11G020900 [Ceratodon purpureus]
MLVGADPGLSCTFRPVTSLCITIPFRNATKPACKWNTLWIMCAPTRSQVLRWVPDRDDSRAAQLASVAECTSWVLHFMLTVDLHQHLEILFHSCESQVQLEKLVTS